MHAKNLNSEDKIKCYLCYKIIVKENRERRERQNFIIDIFKRCVIYGASKELFIVKGKRYKISSNNRFHQIIDSI